MDSALIPPSLGLPLMKKTKKSIRARSSKASSASLTGQAGYNARGVEKGVKICEMHVMKGRGVDLLSMGIMGVSLRRGAGR